MASPIIFPPPFPYFGGKSRVASEVWERFGDVPNYVEPFFGSGAVLLNRPDYNPYLHLETVNDIDGFVANFWRALQGDRRGVFESASRPVNEIDLHAVHQWLVDEGYPIVEKLRADPNFYNAKIAGWWAWGLSCWIGGGWCVEATKASKRIFCTNSGRGVRRKKHLPYQIPRLSAAGQGLTKQKFGVQNLEDDFYYQPQSLDLWEYLQRLSNRLERVRVTCGDWTRVVKPAVTVTNGLTGIFLDPPYQDGRSQTYAHDDTEVIFQVQDWAIKHGNNPMLRIAFCGYEDERLVFPSNWEVFSWVARGGYDGANKRDDKTQSNRFRERIWFSPHCLKPNSCQQLDIFDFIG